MGQHAENLQLSLRIPLI